MRQRGWSRTPLCSRGSPGFLQPRDLASPGSRVQSSRGAVLEMQLRFLRTLLRIVPTPPPLPPPPLPPPPPEPGRFGHLPPRRREPVSLSRLIGASSGAQTPRRRGWGSGDFCAQQALWRGWMDAMRSEPWGRQAAPSERPGWQRALQCGVEWQSSAAQSWGGKERGGKGRRKRLRSRPQSQHHPCVQAGRSKEPVCAAPLSTCSPVVLELQNLGALLTLRGLPRGPGSIPEGRHPRKHGSGAER